jgi:hypothetical protein
LEDVLVGVWIGAVHENVQAGDHSDGAFEGLMVRADAQPSEGWVAGHAGIGRLRFATPDRGTAPEK